MGGVNAATAGVDSPIVLVSQEAIDQLHDGSLRAVLAHELGHILSGHVRYKTAGMFMATLSAATLPAVWTIPFYAGAFAAFRAWDRFSELSADRAALLVTGDIQMLMAPLAGRDPDPPSRHLHGLRDRLPFARAMEPIVDGGWRTYQAHPPTKVRLAALREWERSESYASLIDGHYPRRGDEARQAARWFEARVAVLREGWAVAMAR
jgi:Zn-dependent protease with chaperone function